MQVFSDEQHELVELRARGASKDSATKGPAKVCGQPSYRKKRAGEDGGGTENGFFGDAG